MIINVPKPLEENKTLSRSVARANEFLEPRMDFAKEPVTADWELIRDERGKPALRLTLSDFSGTVSAHFTPEELADTDHREMALLRLGGDLLRKRSRKHDERIQQLLRELESE